MHDLKAKLEQLTADALECDLIANAATDPDKRTIFTDLGAQYRRMAEAIRTVIAERSVDEEI
jgi:hypothetical protein